MVCHTNEENYTQSAQLSCQRRCHHIVISWTPFERHVPWVTICSVQLHIYWESWRVVVVKNKTTTTKTASLTHAFECFRQGNHILHSTCPACATCTWRARHLYKFDDCANLWKYFGLLGLIEICEVLSPRQLWQTGVSGIKMSYANATLLFFPFPNH